jgi:Family of unknown function (DUF6289)
MIGKTKTRVISAILAGTALAGGLALTASAQPRYWYMNAYYSDASQKTIVGRQTGGCIPRSSWGQVTPYFTDVYGFCGAPGQFSSANPSP